MADQPGKFSSLIRQVREENEGDDILLEELPIKELRKAFNREEMENLSVRVPKAWKKHWVVQSKIKEVTLTDIMCKALAEEFGLPENTQKFSQTLD